MTALRASLTEQSRHVFRCQDPLDIKIEYATNGSQWQIIEDNTSAEINQVQWQVPNDAIQVARYRILVVASDGKETSEALNNKVFGVTATPVIYTAQVQMILNTKCAAACHEAPSLTGNLNLTTYNGANAAKQSVLDRTRSTAGSPMPPISDIRKLSE
jgi:hypothetical protein